MRKGKIILIAVLCVLIAALTGVMVWMITLGKDGMQVLLGNLKISTGGNAQLVNEKIIDVAGYQEISVTYRSADLILEPSTSGFTIAEYMVGNPGEENMASIQNDTERKSLTVESGKEYGVFGFFSFGDGIRYVKLGIPEDFQGRLNIKTGSGDITIADICVKEMSIKVGSGDITLQNAACSMVSCVSGSGSMNVGGLIGDLQAETGSGDVQICDVQGNVTTLTGSGEQQITDSQGDVKAQAGSGDLILEYIGGSIEAETGSGDIRIDGLNEKAFRLQVITRSGEIEGSLEEELAYDKEGKKATGTFGKNPEDMVTLKTGSGDITLN